MSDLPNSWIRTHSGKIVYPLQMTAEMLDLTDIAWSLAGIQRYLGHGGKTCSVAEHSIRLSFMVPEPLALTALLHDAAEAYLGDIPQPIKGSIYVDRGGAPLFTRFATVENEVLALILAKYGGVFPLPQEVHDADKLLCNAFEIPNLWLARKVPEGVIEETYSPDWWSAAFLRRYAQLGEGIDNV